MIKPSLVSYSPKNISPLTILTHHYPYIYFLAFIAIIFFNSCSPIERFTKKEEPSVPPTKEVIELPAALELRVMLEAVNQKEVLSIESSSYLYDDTKRISIIHADTKSKCYETGGKVFINVNDETFSSDKFVFSPIQGNEDFIKINGKKFRGKIQVSASENSINLINVVNLEDYVKGVLPKEMPLGKNNENYEALKALAICIRTYAVKKLENGKIFFDLYSDTRDQVYGGADAEHPLSNRAVDETKNLILKFGDKPALLYYHSTCGGYTESAENVFTSYPVPYMTSIKDGDEPFCEISPRYSWKETYTKKEIVNRLRNYSILASDDDELEDIAIIDKFESGRVSQLEIVVEDDNGNEREIILRGNEIRSILRTADNKNILWSTMFDISQTSGKIILTGKGYGHGVGLCQWGAIALSRNGRNYEYILAHYYPGTIIEDIND